MKILFTQKELRNEPHIEGVFFHCSQCGQNKPVQTNGGTGYGYDKQDRPVCYDCCGQNDRKQLAADGKGVLYLVSKDGKLEVTNWPGTLRIPVSYSSTGSHNMARVRHDVWFTFEARAWHGVQYGDNTQICHVKRLK